MKRMTWAEAVKRSIAHWEECYKLLLEGKLRLGLIRSDSCAMCARSKRLAHGVTCRLCPLGKADDKCGKPGSTWSKVYDAADKDGFTNRIDDSAESRRAVKNMIKVLKGLKV